MSDTVAKAQNSSDLRSHAIDRVGVLSQQLRADHADLLHHQDDGKTFGTVAGIESLTRAIGAADLLLIHLKGD